MRLLLAGAAYRARQKGFEFAEALRDLVEEPPRNCACCGKSFDFTVGKGRNHRGRDDSPSLDRVNSAEGYTSRNTAVICYRCNRIKTDATADELMTVARYMRRYAATQVDSPVVETNH
jgi:hypothetical protein